MGLAAVSSTVVRESGESRASGVHYARARVAAKESWYMLFEGCEKGREAVVFRKWLAGEVVWWRTCGRASVNATAPTMEGGR